MPPRPTTLNSIFDFSRLLQNLPNSSTKCTACLFSSTPIQQSGTKKPRRRIDPYRAAQARQRKAANLARQDVLHKERKIAMGNPVRSERTPFLESLLSLRPLDGEDSSSRLNYNLTPELYEKTIAHSKWLAEPIYSEDENIRDPTVEKQQMEEHEKLDSNARRALTTILSLENGGSKDQTRVKIQRCISEFGRHNTDKTLPPKPTSSASTTYVLKSQESRTTLGDSTRTGVEIGIPGRGGPDTGSSEVQAAILTAKINVLADNLQNHDKHNKRNLRLLVHKRQKHLNYLRRKERGGPRWQHLVEKLGISEAMWKGEISM